MTKTEIFLALAESAGSPAFRFPGTRPNLDVLSRASDELLDILIAALQHRVGDPAETRVVDEAARLAVDNSSATPPPWSPGDVFHAAKNLGFPEVEHDGALLKDAATWRVAVDAADPETLEALRAVLAEEPTE